MTSDLLGLFRGLDIFRVLGPAPLGALTQEASLCSLPAGDVLFFSYLTVHGSGINRSDEARTTWLVQYRDPADPPLTTSHDHSLGQGMMLRGVDPTGRAAR